MRTFYITTAIDYANGKPHLGHAYEKVLTDVIARHRRLLGDKVHFLTGLDEHGQKVEQTARAKGIEPAELTDGIAPLFIDLCKRLNISNDDFIRTTEKRHKDVVRKILQDLWAKGDIYRGEYKGYYSVRQEQFVLEKEKNEAGNWPEIYGEVTEISEVNYFFRLSKYQDWLIDYLNKNDFVVPLFRQKQVQEFLREPINDLCISRPKERLSWGIPLPFDEDYVTYVWFDALINYISAVGYGQEGFEDYWPAAFNVIGKDILVPSHSVYWPIMLHAMGIEPPKSLLVHGWWHLGGQKMSKTSGIQINPLDLIDQFGADSLRYFMIREMNVGQDSDFTMELFLGRYQADLGNNLGNLVNRLLNMANRHFPQGLPAPEVEEDPEITVHKQWEETRKAVLAGYDDFQFHSGLERTLLFVSVLNRYAEIRAPWKLAKSEDPKDREILRTSLATMAEGIRLATHFLQPVMPETAERIFGLLGQSNPELWEGQLDWSPRLTGTVLGEKTILFPRPEVQLQPE
ncbi:MAG: methionine--tRNA ligase [Opitutales bacterium]|nr:methionine--tRNA ligase [Opitutales bacterium]